MTQITRNVSAVSESDPEEAIRVLKVLVKELQERGEDLERRAVDAEQKLDALESRVTELENP